MDASERVVESVGYPLVGGLGTSASSFSGAPSFRPYAHRSVSVDNRDFPRHSSSAPIFLSKFSAASDFSLSEIKNLSKKKKNVLLNEADWGLENLKKNGYSEKSGRDILNVGLQLGINFIDENHSLESLARIEAGDHSSSISSRSSLKKIKTFSFRGCRHMYKVYSRRKVSATVQKSSEDTGFPMKILSWNIRGIGLQEKRGAIRKFIGNIRLTFFCYRKLKEKRFLIN